MSSEIIYLVGWLDMQDVVSSLEAILLDPHHYDREPVQLALARLLFEPYYSEMLAKYSFENKLSVSTCEDFSLKEDKLLYICTQESVQEFEKWLYLENRCDFGDNETVCNYSAGQLLGLIENADFVQHFGEEDLSLYYSFPPLIPLEEMEFIKGWMKANRGRLELRR